MEIKYPDRSALYQDRLCGRGIKVKIMVRNGGMRKNKATHSITAIYNFLQTQTQLHARQSQGT